MDTNLEVIIKTFNNILNNFWYDDRICFRTDLREKIKINNEHKWNALLALDIDDTITSDDFFLLDKLLEFCKLNKIKVIFITARFNLYLTNPRDIHMSKLIPPLLDKHNFNYTIDIWYNPFSKINNKIIEIAKTKTIQLEVSRRELDINKSKVMIIDNEPGIVNYAKQNGFIYSTQVSNGDKKGINPQCLVNTQKLIISELH